MPFKSEKQRRYLWANEPDVARKFSAEPKASGGMIKKGIANTMNLSDFSHMRAGGVIGNGSKSPKGVENFQDLMCKKSEGC